MVTAGLVCKHTQALCLIRHVTPLTPYRYADGFDGLMALCGVGGATPEVTLRQNC